VKEEAAVYRTRKEVIRRGLMVASALLLFLFGLLLLFAPPGSRDDDSCTGSLRMGMTRVDNGTANTTNDFSGGGHFCSG
jgi:hypothetical protein